MTVRIATFNAENLFRRPKVFGLGDEEKRQDVLRDYTELVGLLEHETYSDDDKKAIAAIIKKHHVDDSRPDSPRPFLVNETRGVNTLFERDSHAPSGFRIKPAGRAGWTGWVELVHDDVDFTAVHNTGRVIAEVDADIQLMVEVEDRLTLLRFNEQVLGDVLHKAPYPYVYLIDGNDPRGIDVGIFSRYPVTSIRSHVHDPDPDRPGHHLFSRDCPEFEIQLGGTPLWLLGNHLKSKFNDVAGLRTAQARHVASLYQAALERSPHVVVAGDFNDFPDSEGVSAVLATGLRDVMSHERYPDRTGHPGTFHECTKTDQKIDYVLLSPPLWDRVRGVGLERRGIFVDAGGDHFPTITSKFDAASDHAALYVDLDL